MNVAERTAWYAELTGLTRARVQRYRKQVVSEWTTDADRKIASTIRLLERLAGDEALSWDDWEIQAKRLLDVIAQFVEDVSATVKDFVSHIVNAIERVLKALTKLLIRLEPYLKYFLPFLPQARALIGR